MTWPWEIYSTFRSNPGIAFNSGMKNGLETNNLKPNTQLFSTLKQGKDIKWVIDSLMEALQVIGMFVPQNVAYPTIWLIYSMTCPQLIWLTGVTNGRADWIQMVTT